MVAGSGGQGALLAGKILAEAALSERLNVTWFPYYGAAMRGGTSICTVVVSDKPISSPVAGMADVLIAMSRASLEDFQERLHPGGLLVMDSSNIKSRPERSDIRVLEVPVKEMAAGLKLKKPANVILLGAFVGSCPVIDPEMVMDAMKRMKLADVELNAKAFVRGKEFSSVDKKSKVI